MMTVGNWYVAAGVLWLFSSSTAAAGDAIAESVMKNSRSSMSVAAVDAVTATGTTTSSKTTTSTITTNHVPSLLRREQQQQVRIVDTKIASHDHHDSLIPPPHPQNEEEEEEEDEGRELQTSSSSFTYNANYTGQYQLLRDSTCTSPAPVIRVMCAGSSIELLNVSDSSIFCSSDRRVDARGWSYLECTNNCTDSECRAVYLQVDQPSNDGPFAAIEFQCAGNTLLDIEGAVSYEGSDPGACAASSSGITRIYQVLRLGVSCPVDDDTSGNVAGTTTTTNTTNPQQRDYVFDDSYFDCGFGISLPLGGINGDEYYTCLGGDGCDGAACTINLTQIVIYSNSPSFAQQCVGTSASSAGSSITLSPTPLPTAPELVSAGESVTVRFETSWSLMFDDLTGNSCFGFTPIVEIECLYGSRIQYISSIFDTMNCTTISTSVLSCTDTTASNFIDTFTGVVYECTADNVPQSEVTFAENNAYCNGNTIDGVVTHALQLGMYCTLDTYTLFSNDLFFDCVGVSPTFGYLDEFGSTEGSGASRYTCSEAATLPAGSTSAQTKTIPRLSMSTDNNWRRFPDPACYKIVDGTTTNSTTPTGSIATPSPTIASVVVTPAPTIVQTTLAPIPAVTIEETEAPVVAPVPATSAPIVAPVTTTTAPVAVVPAPMGAIAPAANPALTVPASTPRGDTTSSSSSDDGFPVAALAGAVGGVLVVGAAVAAFFVLRKRNNNTNSGTGPPPPVSDHKVAVTPGGGYGGSGPSTAHDATESEIDVGHNNNYPPPPASGRYPPMRNDNYMDEDEVNADEDVHVPVPAPYMPTNVQHPAPAYGSASAYSGSQSSGSNYARQQQPTHTNVNFKDQARSVIYQVPMVDIQPVVAVPVSHPIDMSTETSATGNSRGSDPDGRRSLEP